MLIRFSKYSVWVTQIRAYSVLNTRPGIEKSFNFNRDYFPSLVTSNPYSIEAELDVVPCIPRPPYLIDININRLMSSSFTTEKNLKLVLVVSKSTNFLNHCQTWNHFCRSFLLFQTFKNRSTKHSRIPTFSSHGKLGSNSWNLSKQLILIVLIYYVNDILSMCYCVMLVFECFMLMYKSTLLFYYSGFFGYIRSLIILYMLFGLFG